ncbi:TniQ family protein [Paraburkholderia terrae]|uniref:TniQ family protein n=1 Tax=Paraburkholderia terrae TaxID=311230 RepID=UPI00296B3AEB|nr:TniQ family protein [Paraburkholderia terrae]MDW3663261.1 TniQ family protein [Paraburkholderia terrae]
MKRVIAQNVRPGGWPADAPRRSILFSLSPYGFDGATRENIVSYFRRLSDAHGILPRTLAYGFIVPFMNVRSEASAEKVSDECYHFTVCGLSNRATQWTSALSQLTCRTDLELLTLIPLRGLVSPYELLTKKERYCPACYKEDEKMGRAKYGRLLWTLACVKACPLHRLTLLSEAYDAGRLPLPFTVPGISRVDGSSLAKVRSQKASAYDVRIAMLVAELLEDVVRIKGQELTALSVFLRHAAETLFSGCTVRLAEYINIGKAHVHEWLHCGVIPSLAGIARIAHCFNCAMADVLLGNHIKLELRRLEKLPLGLYGQARQKGHTTSASELRTVLTSFVEENPVASARVVADHLQVSTKFLRKNFPEVNARIVEAARSHRRHLALANREMKDRAFIRVHLELASQGIYPARREVVKRLEKMGIRFRFGETSRAQEKAHTVSGIRKRPPWRTNTLST